MNYIRTLAAVVLVVSEAVLPHPSVVRQQSPVPSARGRVRGLKLPALTASRAAGFAGRVEEFRREEEHDARNKSIYNNYDKNTI